MLAVVLFFIRVLYVYILQLLVAYNGLFLTE